MSPPLSKQDVTTLTQRNADYYWMRWTPLIQGQNWTSFNWPAFFFTGFWLAYRKMYSLALLFFGILLLGVLADQMNLERKESFSTTFGWIIALVCGARQGGTSMLSSVAFLGIFFALSGAIVLSVR